jgi:hypothetical protein
MKAFSAALAIACLSSSVWAAEPAWNWIEVLSTGQGLRTEEGKAKVTMDKRSIRVTFFDEKGSGVRFAFKGNLAPPRVSPLFKNKTALDISGTFTVEGSDYGSGPRWGTYLKDSYSGRIRNQMNLSCIETIVLSDGYNTITANHTVNGHHDC